MRAAAAAAARHPPCRAAPAAFSPRSSTHAVAAAAASAAAAAGEGDKWVHLVRHGETDMNVALGRLPPGARYGEPAFVDPCFPDTRLTARGRQQARAARAAAAALAPPPEVVVVSPLTRALQTAEIVFEGHSAPWVAHHAAAERRYLSSDEGRSREELEAEFPGCCFLGLPLSGSSTSRSSSSDGTGGSIGSSSGSRSSRGTGGGNGSSGGVWWHTAERQREDEARWEGAELASEDELQLIAAHEPAATFLRRVERLRQWLASRPECSLALVSHWGVLHALTGAEFHNCEVRSLRIRDLRARPHLLRPRQVPAGQAW